ncbi:MULTISPECIES: hypothetical protein [Metabacillus]|uniref:Uncharacterized protein n=2 Tax=Metabacillus TaxID=2675233 RepID=A0A179SMV4_9BACI|nr:MULTISPECIES: hypothetical protein [Metabacillus]OAS82704.1 hypothetical protein A6K24_11295 [Metabacillus litoralis]QNF30142.1 hypothetical protein HUW50_23375 [Metabacillus sp. KUDC1714]
MNKGNLKIIVLMIGIFLISLNLIGCKKNEESSGETKIFEIDNTEEIFGKKDDEVVTVKKHYMILNPPKDLIQLKELIEKYSKDHPVEEEMKVIEGKNRIFDMSLYRESEDLPRDWQPDESYMNTDRLEHHKNDLIAYIIWSDAEPQKEFNVYDKNKEGNVIKRMRFIEDQLVE